jgi:Zn-finger nucleic acid-binding protein
MKIKNILSIEEKFTCPKCRGTGKLIGEMVKEVKEVTIENRYYHVHSEDMHTRSVGENKLFKTRKEAEKHLGTNSV